jgi:hypothetical protein
MAVNTKGKLEITDLDFDTIKGNLKTYLKGQSEFTDYDFEGSGLSVLLDVLAYNTHYNAFVANMVANEMFLDTAVNRSSVISLAKALGYTPVGSKSSKAIVDITVHDATGPSLTLLAGHTFMSKASGTAYQFVNISDVTIIPSSGVYKFSDVEIYEGSWVEVDYTVNVSDVDQKFILDNKRIDISTLTVKIQNSDSDTVTTTFQKANNLVEVKSDSNVFFVQETTKGEWEVYFGDGVVGKELTDGNIVKVSYIVTNEDESNGAIRFVSGSAIGGFVDITVSTNAAASGGAVAEELDTIKHNAPFNYTAQNRAVTANDYKTLVPQIYSNVDSIAVWGGEYNDPPVYGKVYISIRPKGGAFLTDTSKADIKKKLKDYTVASVTPELINPEIVKIVPSVNFKYDSNITTKTQGDLETLVRAAIVNYSTTQLARFEGIFRFSKFTAIVDDTDTAIMSNISTIKVSTLMTPTLASSVRYDVKFQNPLYNPGLAHVSPVVESSGFVMQGNANTLYFDDDGSGNLRTYYLTGTLKSYVNATAGTVDYATGAISITALTINSVSNSDGTITFTVIPNSNDLVPVRNQIFEIDSSKMEVVGAEDTIATGSSNAGTGYTTSTSYS